MTRFEATLSGLICVHPSCRMTCLAQQQLEQSIRADGFCLIGASDATRLLEAHGVLSDWGAFSASWNRLEVDTYMADAGRYRRRRHGLYQVRHGALTAAQHRPHFQSLDYNTLNGGIERWYAPIEPAVSAGASMGTILAWCHACFDNQRPEAAGWDVEVHQFRIEASPGAVGLPTPEGMHRDGVDYVLVLLIERMNVESGTTTIGGADGASLGSFTLTHPLDAVMLDDHRVLHGVTAIEPLQAACDAHRDVLVVTFRSTAPGDLHAI